MATRIMVIDDEPLICRLLEYQLGGAGYEVAAYPHAHDALLALARSQPDMILLDVMMPEISGWDLCRQLRSSSDIPIIMLTAKDGDDDMVRGLTSGADDYVGKPFNQTQLVARIEAVLRRTHASAQRGRNVAPPPPVNGANHVALALAAPVEPPPLAALPLLQPPARTQTTRLGPRFAEARQQLGLTLHDAGQASGVRWEFLQAIENEECSFIPRSELRHALRTYSAFLEVDLTPYAHRSVRWAKPLLLPLAVGIGIAITITLVLFVLLV